MKNLLMIDPPFPHPKKSPNHQDVLPVGLLKIGSYYQKSGWDVKLQRLSESIDPIPNFQPSKIIVTSLFSYWSEYIKDAVDWAREYYPNVNVEVGGIFASLQPKLCKEVTGCDSVYVGVMDEVEDCLPNYSLLSQEPTFQIIHTSRGCNRKCHYCGVNCIEPQQTFIKSIKDRVFKKKLIFYDNNLLANPYIETILRELILLKSQRKITNCESQSGFDGRILRKKPYLGEMLKRSGFIYPKIAWDGSVKSWKNRKKEIEILEDSGFRRTDMSVFMLFNHDMSFSELELKRMHCWDWRVQVTPCRFRPYTQLFDNYSGGKRNQTNDDYFIHPNWTDEEIKQFNRNTRRHNMAVRFRINQYSKIIEYRKISKEKQKEVKYMEFSEAIHHLDDAWNPAEFHYVEKI